VTSTTGTERSTADNDSALPSPLRVGLARGGIEIKQFFREKDAVVFSFGFPIILLFVFGSVFSGEIAPGVQFRQYFASGMIASGLMVTAFQNLAIQIPAERDDGMLVRLRGTPMPPAAYFIGKVIVVLFNTVAQIAILMGLGVLLYGLDAPRGLDGWLTLAWVTVLGSTACTVLGLAFSSVPRSGRSAPAIVSPLAILLQFMSGVFIVYNDLPTWMQQVAALFPLKWMAQGMRSVFLPDSFRVQESAGSWEHGRVAIVLVAWIVIGLVATIRTFRWRRRDAG
jgi:ABC-2 type transport system permease protein